MLTIKSIDLSRCETEDVNNGISYHEAVETVSNKTIFQVYQKENSSNSKQATLEPFQSL